MKFKFKPRHLLIILILLTLSVGYWFYAFSVSCIESAPLPSVEELENPEQSLATRVYSSDGELLDYFSVQKRVNLTYNEIPRDFINALIATEDRQFYDHWGVHVERTFRAVIKTVMYYAFGMFREQGGSTITQQLARKLYLDQERSVRRKIREMYTAIMIEENFTKNEILEMYTNQVYFGNGAYGLDIASRNYFGKKTHELTLTECAYLVGVVNSPGYYNAFKYYDRGIRRRNVVLASMLDQGHITETQYWKYVEEELLLNKGDERSTLGGIAPHYIEYIRQTLGSRDEFSMYNLHKDGLNIYTSLDSRIQRFALEAVDSHLTSYQKRFNKAWTWNQNKQLLNSIIKEAIRKHPEYKRASGIEKKNVKSRLERDDKFIDSVKNSATTIQCGVVVLDPKTGAVLAMVGASSKFMSENKHAKHSLNHVTQIRRQPGSSFKPFVYAMALKEGLFPEDTIDCGPFSYFDSTAMEEPWEPRSDADDCDSTNYKTLREGLRRSINSIAARLITEHTSPQKVLDVLRKAGIESYLLPVPALALGAGGEVKPIEVATAFTTFANNGYSTKPYYITKIEDQFNSIVFERKKSLQITDALDKSTANTIAEMLESVVNRGTAGRVRVHFKDIDCAGKTGTTNDNADAWFTGFTPELLCSVWVGFDDQRVTFDAIGTNGQGGRAAGPIFGMLMDKIYKSEEINYRIKQFSFNTAFDKDTTNVQGVEVIRRNP